MKKYCKLRVCNGLWKQLIAGKTIHLLFPRYCSPNNILKVCNFFLYFYFVFLRGCKVTVQYYNEEQIPLIYVCCVTLLAD